MSNQFLNSLNSILNKAKVYFISSGKKYVSIIMCFLTWFSSAFIFVQIPAISKEIKIEIFPSTDVVTSILMVAITLCISLIARFLGGLTLGSFTNSYGVNIIVYSIIGLSIITFSQIILIDNIKSINEVIAFPYIFIIIRFLIGFCIGGIWPNLGIFVLEEFYRKNNESNDNEKFRKKVQRYGIKSAFIQTGLTFSFLIESIIIIIIAINSSTIEQYLGVLSLNSNLLQIQFTSVTGLFLLSIVSVYWLLYTRKSKSLYYKYYSKFLSLNSKNNSLSDLLTNKKYRYTLVNLWLIMTGLMYMYYSTVIVTPELLYRLNFEDLVQSFPILNQEEWITIGVTILSFLGHIALGFIYFKNKYDNKEDQENKDISWIYNISKRLIWSVIAIIFIYFFISNIDHSKNNSITISFMITVQIILAFLANLPWGLIPSIITSRFPKHFRFLAASLAYNGGLIISFAAPFFIQQVILYTLDINDHNSGIPNYYIILIPMILGGLSVWWGSRTILKDFLPSHIKGEKEYGYFEIRIPFSWGNPIETSDKIKFNRNSITVKEQKFFEEESNSPWKMSIYFLENKNYPKFLQHHIFLIVRILIKIKVKDEYILRNLSQLAVLMPWYSDKILKVNEEYINESDEKEIYINSKLANKKSFFIKDCDDIITSLIIPYSNHVYIIIYKENENNSKDNNILSKVIDTFDIKIPLKGS